MSVGNMLDLDARCASLLLLGGPIRIRDVPTKASATIHRPDLEDVVVFHLRVGWVLGPVESRWASPWSVRLSSSKFVGPSHQYGKVSKSTLSAKRRWQKSRESRPVHLERIRRRRNCCNSGEDEKKRSPT